jgi:hypothetical protein
MRSWHETKRKRDIKRKGERKIMVEKRRGPTGGREGRKVN